MRHTQRGIAHLARLFAKDGSKQAFLCRQLGFTLGRHLADQNIAGVYLRTHADNALIIQILQALRPYVRDVAGNLFRPQFGVACFAFQLLDVNRGKHILFHHLFADQHSVFIVIALPRHKADEDISS